MLEVSKNSSGLLVFCKILGSATYMSRAFSLHTRTALIQIFYSGVLCLLKRLSDLRMTPLSTKSAEHPRHVRSGEDRDLQAV